MSQITPASSSSGHGRPHIRPHHSDPSERFARSERQGGDSTHFSSTLGVEDRARFIAKLRETPGVRLDMVREIKSQIADGTYDTPEKIKQALEAMSKDIDLLA